MEASHKDIRKILAPAFRDIASRAGLPKQFRPYQTKTLLKTADWLDDISGTHRGYINHATGLGKTVQFAGMIRAAEELRSLVIVPTKTLITQTLRELSKWSPGLLGHLSGMSSIQDRDGELIAIRGLEHSSVVITTDASFKKYATRIREELNPHLILRDECHWGYDNASIEAMDLFEEAVIIGFSATPDYLTNRMRGGYTPVELDNGQVLYGPRDRFAETHFQTLIDRRSLRWGIEEGYLAPMRWGLIDFDKDVSLKKIRIVDGTNGPDFDKNELQALLEESWDAMCETIKRLYEQNEYDLSQRQVCAVCPSVRSAQELAETIQSLGLSAACIHGEMPDMERNIILEAYRQNEIRFLSSVRVLREGWDDPGAEVCMMLTPTASRVFYEQPIGRITRLPEDGSPKVSLVLDAHFQGQTFHPLSAPALYAPPGSEIPVGNYLMRKKGGGTDERFESREPLPHAAKPRIIVVDDYTQIQEVEETAKCGILHADGEEWITLTTMAKRMKIASCTISKRLKKHPCRTRYGKTQKGQSRTFYALTEITAICHSITHALEHLPKIGSDRRCHVNGKIWTTLNQATKELGIGEPAIIARLVTTPCRNMQAQVKGHAVTVFLLDDLRSACDDLLNPDLIQLNGQGIGSVGKTPWYILKALAKRFGTENRAVKTRLDSKKCTTKKGRLRSGQIADCYPLKEAEKICRDLIKRTSELPRAINGSFYAERNEWANPEALAERFGLSRTTVKSKLAKSDCRTRIGVNGKKGREYTYYNVKDAKKILFDPRVKTLPKADHTGSFTLEGIEWAPISTLTKRWSIAYTAIQRRVRPDNCRMREGRTTQNQITMFFAVEDVRRAIQDILENPRGPRPPYKKGSKKQK